ncbi:MAG: hypothetical protein MI921_02935 [Cytophagales bacterium]|nr:hypothetical protein [Cytophagales bacterium]
MEVESFKRMNTEREYQIIVELKDDHEQNAKYPNLNTDSYLVHLPNPRWSDIQKFIWKGIQHFKELSGNIGFRQKKLEIQKQYLLIYKPLTLLAPHRSIISYSLNPQCTLDYLA